jgi:hypothetical protein
MQAMMEILVPRAKKWENYKFEGFNSKNLEQGFLQIISLNISSFYLHDKFLQKFIGVSMLSYISIL